MSGRRNETAQVSSREAAQESSPALAGRLAEILRTNPREAAVVAAMALVAVVLQLLVYRDGWFYADIWDYLATREIGSPDDLLRSHGGHWVTTVVVATRAMFSVVGFDYWPGFVLPRVVAYVAMCLTMWGVARVRGADAWWAGWGLAVLLVLGSSGYLAFATIGSQVAFIASIVVAWWMANDRSPSSKRRAAAFALMALALASSPETITIVAGMVLVIALDRGLRPWILPLAANIAVYVAWYLTFGGTTGAVTSGLGTRVLELPVLAGELVGSAVAQFVGFPTTSWPLGALLLLAVFAAIGGLAALRTGPDGEVRRHVRAEAFDRFDVIFVTGGVLFVLLALLVRVGAGRAQVTANRYGFVLTMYLAVVLLGKVRLPSKVARGIWSVVGVALVLTNLNTFLGTAEFWVERGRASKPIIEAEAALIAAGEPFVERARADFRAGILRVGDLPELVDELEASRVDELQHDAITEARGRIRVAVLPGRATGGDAPVVTDVEVLDSCASAPAGEGVQLRLNGPSRVHLVGEPGTDLELSWVDDYGVGAFNENIGRRNSSLELAEPSGDTTVELLSSGALQICGVRSE